MQKETWKKSKSMEKKWRYLCMHENVKFMRINLLFLSDKNSLGIQYAPIKYNNMNK